MQEISPADLMIMTESESLKIKLAYADANYEHNMFDRIYRADMPLVLHKEMAAVVKTAAVTLYNQHGWQLLCLDGLRTVDAQKEMHRQAKEKAFDFIHFSEDSTGTLSLPGGGGHPRGLAVDVHPLLKGNPVDVGSHFDDFWGPAERHRTDIAPSARENRQKLDHAFIQAAQKHDFPLLLLPQEWWDFRATYDYYMALAPLSESDLPAEMKML